MFLSRNGVRPPLHHPNHGTAQGVLPADSHPPVEPKSDVQMNSGQLPSPLSSPAVLTRS